MNLFDITNNLPEYYDTMYLDGYTPTEIYAAQKKRMRESNEDRDNEIEVVNLVKEK